MRHLGGGTTWAFVSLLVCGSALAGYMAFQKPTPKPPPADGAFRFWSLHGGGTYFALADGSVRFVSYSAASGATANSARTSASRGIVGPRVGKCGS